MFSRNFELGKHLVKHIINRPLRERLAWNRDSESRVHEAIADWHEAARYHRGNLLIFRSKRKNFSSVSMSRHFIPHPGTSSSILAHE